MSDGQNLSEWQRRRILTVTLMAGHIVTAIAIGYIVGGGAAQSAEVYLFNALNVFAIPLVFVNGLGDFPLWVWYIILFSWSGELYLYYELEK
jgi:hypothetical protein